jgi:PAS domain-containing protein
MRTNGTPPPSSGTGGSVETRSVAEAILEGMPDAVTLFDSSHRVVYRNAASHLLYAGTPLADVTGMTMEQIAARVIEAGERLMINGREMSAAQWAAFVRSPEGVRYERQIFSGRHVEIQYKTLADGSVLGIARDISERKQHEAEVARARGEADRARSLMGAVLSGMSDAVMLCDPAGRVVYRNKAAEELFAGTPLGQGAGMTLREIAEALIAHGDRFEHDGEKLTAEEWVAYVSRPEGVRYERRLLSGRDVEVSFQPLPDGSLLAIYRDISRRKRREEEAERARIEALAAKELMAAVLGGMTDGVALFDRELRLVFENDAVRGMFGVAAGAWQPGRTLGEILELQRDAGRPLIVDGAPASVEDVLAGIDKPAGARCERLLPDGRYVELRFRRVADGTVIGVMRDITEFRERQTETEKARDEAAAVHRLMMNVLETMVDGVRLYDVHTQIIYQNRAISRILGPSAYHEEIGMTIAEVFQRRIDENDVVVLRDKPQAPLEERLAQFHSVEGGSYEVQRNGRIVEVTIRPVGDGKRLGVFRDVTDLRRRQDEIERARDRLQDAQDLMNEVLEGMSDGVRLYDSEMRLVYENSAVRDIYGVLPDASQVGMTLPDILHAQIEAGLDLVIDGEKYTVAEAVARVTSREGTRYFRTMPNGRYVEFQFQPLQDGRTLCVLRDLSEIHRQQAELVDSQRLTSAVLDNMTDGLRLFDADERLVFENRAFLRMSGTDAGAELGMTAEDIFRRRVAQGDTVAGTTAERDVAHRLDQFRSDDGGGYELMLQNGHTISIRFRPAGAGRRLGVYSDITEQKQRQAELERARDASTAAQQRLNTVLENMVDGVRLFDAEERLVYQNAAAGEIFSNPDAPQELGLTLEEIITKRIAHGSSADSAGRPLDRDARLRLFRTPGGSRFETSLPTGRRVEIIYRPLDDGGKLAIFRDITAMQQRSGKGVTGQRVT